MVVDVIIPALDEEGSIADVVRGVLATGVVREVLVVDNGSRDATADRARAAGARVVGCAQRGYGVACLAGIAALADGCEVVGFVDADGSDAPDDLLALVRAIDSGADLVIGSRVLGDCEPGALTPQQRVGNGVASVWLRARFGLPTTDLGPFRCIRKSVLDGFGMSDESYGWTIEMQIKAAQQRVHYAEVPVRYRKRQAGVSKVSGTLRGVAGATVKILGLLAYHDLKDAWR
jgi:glycosyltransferase involved in cell wall biosynthesis